MVQLKLIEVINSLIAVHPNITFFVGAGAFYAVLNYVEGIKMWEAAFVVLLYCSFGLASGWMTIAFRQWYEKPPGRQNRFEQEERIHE